MRLFKFDPKVDIVEASGILRVTVRPQPSLALLLFEISIACYLGVETYRNSATISLVFRAFLFFGAVSIAGGLIYQLSGTEIVEFSAHKLRICKEIHGWERKREYGIEDCSKLQWIPGAEDAPDSLQCSVGWRKIKLGKHLSEDQATEIFAALQKSLPEITTRLCSFPSDKGHFITLDLK